MDVLKLFIVDAEYGDDVGVYNMKKKGNRWVAVNGDWPFEKSHIWLTENENGSFQFHIYEGSHWERGERDDSITLPGYLDPYKKDWYITISEEDALREKREAKSRYERHLTR